MPPAIDTVGLPSGWSLIAVQMDANSSTGSDDDSDDDMVCALHYVACV